jgi:hypothetical protein
LRREKWHEDRHIPPHKRRNRPPAATGEAANRQDNSSKHENSPRPLKPQARRPSAANFNLGRHLLDEGLSPPLGFAWLFHRTGGRLCVSHYLIEEVGDQTIAGTA